MTKYRKTLSELLPVFLLTISVLIFFCKVISSGKPLFGSDFVLYFYPVKAFIRDYVSACGALPFWNPYVFSGTPFIANIQASMFYPLGFLFYIMPTEYAYGYTIIIHCILGSIFMYVFVRSLSVNKAGAFLSAIIFTYNGFFVAHLYAGHLTFVQNYVWIPLIFLYLHRFLNTPYFRYAILTGTFLGIQILGGFPQIAFYTIFATLLYALYVVCTRLTKGDWPFIAKIGVGTTAIVMIGFSLAAVQLLPTYEFTQLSTRAGGVNYAFATYDSLHPKELLLFFIPELFGNVIDKTYWLSPKHWHFWETCGYVGILPLCLIFVYPRSGSMRYLRLFLLALTVLSLFLALGKYNPMYPIIYKLPGFNSFRIPTQILFLCVFGLAATSGMGLHRAVESDWLFSKHFSIFLLSVGLLLLCLIGSLHFFPHHFFFHLFKTFSEAHLQQIDIAAVYDKITFAVQKSALLFLASALLLLIRKHRRLNERLWSILVTAVVMIDLGLFGMQFVKPYEVVTPPDKQRLVEQLNRNAHQGRVTTLGATFKPNDGLTHRFPSVLGYDPLVLKRYLRYIETSQHLPPDDRIVSISRLGDPSAKLLRLLNLRQVLHEQDVADIDPNFSYATIVNKAVIKPADDVLGFMMEDAFEPNEMVVLESEYRPCTMSNGEEINLQASGSDLVWNHETIRIKAYANQPCYLVLSEIFYPGWEASVDGEKVPILRGNYLFRVVPLKKGIHEVELRFVSWPFRVGAITSLLTLAICLGFIMRKQERPLPKT